MTTTIRPLGDRLIVRRDVPTETTASGLIIPDNAKERPQRGVVVAVGAGKLLENGTRVPVAVNVGDTVLWGKYAGQDVGGLERVVEGAEGCLLIREEDVLGVVQ